MKKYNIFPAVGSAYILMLAGRRNQPGLENFRGWRYAHRGLHDACKPENSLAAFRAAAEHGFGAELDVHLLKDGNLAVIHDSDLLRVTGREGTVEELVTADLKNYHLMGSEETIPEFREVLEIFRGKAPIIVELKTAGGNYAALTRTACRMLEAYDGLYCMESFDPNCVRWLRSNRPEIIRGQLSENAVKRSHAYPLPLRFAATNYLMNFLTRPDFIAHRFDDRRTLSVALIRKFWHIQGVSWTIQSPEDLEKAEKEGWLPIFEGFIPEECPARTGCTAGVFRQ